MTIPCAVVFLVLMFGTRVQFTVLCVVSYTVYARERYSSANTTPITVQYFVRKGSVQRTNEEAGVDLALYS